MPDSHLIDRLAALDSFPEGSPLPDGWLDDLDPSERGSTIVTALHELKPAEPETRGPNWRLIAAIAAIVVVLATTIVWFQPDPPFAEDPPPTTVPLSLDERRIAAAMTLTELFYEDDSDALAAIFVDPSAATNFLNGHVHASTINADLVSLEGCAVITGERVRCNVVDVDDVARAFDEEINGLITVTYESDSDNVLTADYQDDGAGNTGRFYSWHNTTYPTSDECAGWAENGVPDDPAICWAFIIGNIPEFKETSPNYIP